MTVGVRTTYVRDMATTEPPLLGAIDRLRAAVDRPLLAAPGSGNGSFRPGLACT